MRTVGDLLASHDAERLIGRTRELGVLLRMLEEDGPLVVFVHGVGGIGKTALVETFASTLRRRGLTVIMVDCRTVEPTKHALLDELAAAAQADEATLGGVVARLHREQPVIVILDSYERFNLLDTWIRQTLVPSLPANTRVVVAGRRPPAPAWRAEPTDDAPVCDLLLQPLTSQDAVRLLTAAGLDPEFAERVNRLAHGHPLALQVARAAASQRPNLDFEETTAPRVVDELTRLYRDELSPIIRRVLDAASTVRRATASLLAVMLPDLDPHDALDRLRALPFVEVARDGLHLHDTFREAVAAALRSADPSRYRSHPSRRLATAAKRGSRRAPRRPLALHRRPALPHREPHHPRGVLPHHRQPSGRGTGTSRR